MMGGRQVRKRRTISAWPRDYARCFYIPLYFPFILRNTYHPSFPSDYPRRLIISGDDDVAAEQKQW